MIIDIKSAAVGKWASINTLLGIDSKHFNGKHGPCPLCPDGGKDRWRWNPKTEHAHCNVCGSLSGMDLAIAYTGKTFRELAPEIKQSILGVATVTVTPDYNTTDTDKNKQRLERVHKTLIQVGAGKEVIKYLASRGIGVAPEASCYESRGIGYFQDGQKIGEYKAMVSVFRNSAGETCSYHITYLQDGKKAEVEFPKKILPAIRPLSGSAIQLFQPVNGVLAVAEGIETALAVHQLEGLPVWACGNAQLMAALELPASVNQLHIYADQDASFTGQQAAYTLAKKTASKGVAVQVHMPAINDKWVTDDGRKYDFLDRLILDKHERKKQTA